MEIIYRLKNLSRLDGKRFYVGSKSACKVITMDGVKTMINVNTGKPYYSSSTSFDFKKDLANGHIFEVEILQKVPMSERSRLVEIENEWIIKLDAVNNHEYYNLGYALLNCRDPGKLANKFGETVNDLAKNNSSTSKRDNTAHALGFSNFGELCFHIYDLFCEYQNWATIAKFYGKDKGYFRMMLLNFDMEKARKDLSTIDTLRIRKLLAENCSLVKACEICGVELPAGRVALGDYKETRNFSVAFNQGKTKEELELEVTKLVLDGHGLLEVSDKLGITYTSAKRYFFRCIRKRFKSSDLE